MTQEKIKARLPKTIDLMYDLNKNTVRILHDGMPIEKKLPEYGKSLDWYLEGADLLFRSEAADVELRFQDIPSGGMQGFLIARYTKIKDAAANTKSGPQRHIKYVTDQCYAGMEIEVDAKLVEAYRKRVAHKLDFKKRDTSFH